MFSTEASLQAYFIKSLKLKLGLGWEMGLVTTNLNTRLEFLISKVDRTKTDREV